MDQWASRPTISTPIGNVIPSNCCLGKQTAIKTYVKNERRRERRRASGPVVTLKCFCLWHPDCQIPWENLGKTDFRGFSFKDIILFHPREKR